MLGKIYQINKQLRSSTGLNLTIFLGLSG